jgi:hypothetical protein
VSSDDHLFSIKIDHSISDSRKHSAPTTTPKRPPRYAVITPEESLMEAITSQDAHSTAHTAAYDKSSERHARSVAEVSTELLKDYSDVKAHDKDAHFQLTESVVTPGTHSRAAQCVDADSSPGTTEGDAHGATYWKQIANDMEHQLDEAEVLTAHRKHLYYIISISIVNSSLLLTYSGSTPRAWCL